MASVLILCHIWDTLIQPRTLKELGKLGMTTGWWYFQVSGVFSSTQDAIPRALDL